MDLMWGAIIALGIAIVAGALGFSGRAATIAKVVFGIFLVLAIALFILAVL